MTSAAVTARSSSPSATPAADTVRIAVASNFATVIDEIAARFREVIAAHGPQAILPYSYAGNLGVLGYGSMDRRVFHALGASLLDRTICATAGAAGYEATVGATVGFDPEASFEIDAAVLEHFREAAETGDKQAAVVSAFDEVSAPLVPQFELVRDAARAFGLPAVEVKGATMTGLRVAQERDGSWVAECVVDV